MINQITLLIFLLPLISFWRNLFILSWMSGRRGERRVKKSYASAVVSSTGRVRLLDHIEPKKVPRQHARVESDS